MKSLRITGHALRWFLLLSLAGAIGTELLAAEDPEVTEIREDLKELAIGLIDRPDRPEPDGPRERILRKGEKAMGIIRQLFLESRDDRFREMAFGMLYAFPNGIPVATEMIDSALAKDPADWGGHSWIYGALIRLDRHDTRKTKEVAVRALALEKYRLQSVALGFIMKHADRSDIAVLERFRDRLVVKTPDKDRDQLLRETDSVIRTIEERLASESGRPWGDPKAGPSTESRAAKTAKTDAITVPPAEREARTSGYRAVIFVAAGLALLAVLTAIVLRRRTHRVGDRT